MSVTGKSKKEQQTYICFQNRSVPVLVMSIYNSMLSCKLNYVQTDATTSNIVWPKMLGVIVSVLAVVCKRMQQVPTMLGLALAFLSCWLESLAGFKLWATTPNNTQQHATGCQFFLSNHAQQIQIETELWCITKRVSLTLFRRTLKNSMVNRYINFFCLSSRRNTFH